MLIMILIMLNDACWAWEKLYIEAVEKLIPKRKAKVRKETLPWITTEIRKLIFKRFMALKSIRLQKIEMTWKHTKGSEIK